MQFWVIQTLNSVAFGGLLFLLSSGFSLIFGLMRIPNLAHGAVFMLGAYFGATFIELGYPEMTTSVWFGFMAPAATPRNIIAKLNSDMDMVLRRPDVREQLIGDGQEPGGGTGEEFEAFLRNEIVKYAKVIKLAGIRVE